MSRSDYDDDIEQWDLIRWRGAVTSAIRGQRGQQLLTEMLAALDAMPEKRLIAGELETSDGSYCALGVVGKARGLPLGSLDPEDAEAVAKTFNIAPALAREIVYVNDEEAAYWRKEAPDDRWRRVRAWVTEQIASVTSQDKATVK